MRCSPSIVCKHAYLIPPVASFAISISGIVVALIYKNSYLTIPPGVGLSISVYFTKLSIDMKELKSFRENNDRMAEQVNQMTKENLTLKRTGETLAGEVTKLQGHVHRVEEQLGVHTKNNAVQGDLIKQQAVQLEEQRKVDQQQRERIEALTALNQEQSARFQQMSECLKVQSQELGGHCATFVEVAAELKSEVVNIASVQVKLKEQQEDFLNRCQLDKHIQKQTEETRKFEEQNKVLSENIMKQTAVSEALEEQVNTIKLELNRQGKSNDRMESLVQALSETPLSRSAGIGKYETENTTATHFAL